MCSVNATSALRLEMCSVYRREPWFRSAGAIQKYTALLLPLHQPYSLPTSLALAPCSALRLAPAPQPLLCPSSSSAKAPFLSSALILSHSESLLN